LERCEPTQRFNNHKGFTLFSDEPHHKGLVHLPLSESFEAEIRSLSTTIRGTTYNGIGGSRTATSDHTRVSTTTRASRVQGHKSNKFTNFQLPRILVESKNRCNEAMARAQVLKSFTLKSHHKQLMLMGGEERKNKEENHTRTPRSRSTRFPSLRGDIDWWKCRSRSSPSILQRSTSLGGGIGRSSDS
jgi:hypothetical protein